ncbi:MAG TPA: ABC transporter ATP-binding protein, partial [Lactobacillus sp.]|nr:ABC transporter ATP-binding protein [Lactobacillus sp.]
MKTVIKVKNVQKTYDKRVILKQVDLEIKKGEIVALLGRNGAGKSTLLNVLLQLVSKDQGEIEILGEKRLKTEAIGVMLQNELTLERTTVKEILELWRSYYPKSKSYAELLTIADLEEKQETFIAKLSGGQRRSLQFALCLAGDPEVIFLDEPTVGMDLKHRQKFWEQIKKLQTAGKTFLITSHYLEELQNVVQRFLILKDGSIAFAGTLQELQQNGQKVTFRFTS